MGAGPSLGDWDVAKGIAMTWQEGDVWKATIEVPAGETISIKVILKKPLVRLRPSFDPDHAGSFESMKP